MSADSDKLIREGKALLHALAKTSEPAARQKLKAEYFAIADELFPEAGRLHRTLARAPREDRSALKKDYVQLVHRLWAERVSGGTTAEATGATVTTRRTSAPLAIAACIVLVSVSAVGIVWYQFRPSVAPASHSAAVSTSSAVTESPGAPPTEPVAVESGNPEIEIEESEVVAPERVPEIVAELTPLPEDLVGMGDTITVDGTIYTDVYVRESGSAYYVQFPGTGEILRVDRAAKDLDLQSGTEPGREAIRVHWERNRDAVQRAASERVAAEERAEAERARAMVEAQRDKERQAKIDSEIAKWRVREAEWVALSPADRNRARAQLYGNWRTAFEDIGRAEELYERIGLLYEFLGIHRARRLEVTQAYNEIRSVRGPRYDVEDKLIQAGLEEREGLRIAAEWEAEYRELTSMIEKQFPKLEREVADIQRLDLALAPETRGREDSYDWESPWVEEPFVADGEARTVGFGTGFVVATNFVMTCDHVLGRANTCKVISTDGTEFKGTVNQRDRSNDWCLIKVEGLEAPPIPINAKAPNVGAVIHCIGYPLAGLRDSIEPVAGSGNVAALQRFDGDDRFVQVTAPVNPGNSGGPLLNEYGQWIGIVSQKLNDMATLEAASTVAQGFNFATKASFVERTVDSRRGVVLHKSARSSERPLSLEEIVKRAKPSIVKIEVEH